MGWVPSPLATCVTVGRFCVGGDGRRPERSSCSTLANMPSWCGRDLNAGA